MENISSEQQAPRQETAAERYTRRGFLGAAALGFAGAVYVLSQCKNLVYYEGISIEECEQLDITTHVEHRSSGSEYRIVWPGGSLPILSGSKTSVTRRADGTICISNGENTAVLSAGKMP